MAPKRVPQTASLRRCASERLAKDAPSSSIVPYHEEDVAHDDVLEYEDEVEVQEVAVREVESPDPDSDIDELSTKGPFPCGPQTNELLVDYRHHIAYRVWNGKPAKTLDSWDLEKESLTFTDRLKESGLWPLRAHCFKKTLNNPLITAIVE
ncbi:hypothetical protein QJS10_CPA01g01783 [Acorus calamus]|uniref:Chromo domain-containing protein n=1 Tax=Acorus calamus TaxID=4465 RepID=A0AAV9FIJ5_ACOCL|nr:hypothetical protein QJS10_CPA01g01783 [Acorus calamus]